MIYKIHEKRYIKIKIHKKYMFALYSYKLSDGGRIGMF